MLHDQQQRVQIQTSLWSVVEVVCCTTVDTMAESVESNRTITAVAFQHECGHPAAGAEPTWVCRQAPLSQR